MIKRLMILYIALHLAFGPVVSAFASTCSVMQDQATPHEECQHHQMVTTQSSDQNELTHDDMKCHEPDSNQNTADRCGCHCPASTAGLITTAFPPLADDLAVPFAFSVQTQHSITNPPLYKPPRA